MISSLCPAQPLRPTLGTQKENPLLCATCDFISVTSLSEIRRSQKLNGIPTATSHAQSVGFHILSPLCAQHFLLPAISNTGLKLEDNLRALIPFGLAASRQA